MRKFFVALVATFVIMFGGVSLAAPGGQSDDKQADAAPDRGPEDGEKGPEKGEKGNACPDQSPNPERTPPPGCGVTDSDGDGVPDQGDNCPEDENPGQEDTDGDGIGDACDDANGGTDPDPDPDTDTDGDGVPDGEDNCPDTPADEADEDGDGCGDVTQDNCPDTNNDQTDSDGDGVGDACDGCPDDAAETDADGDGCEDDGGVVAQGCTEAGGDAGLAGDTIAQQLYDGGASALPIVVDPEGDGLISGELKAGGNETPLEPLTNEVACVVSLPAAGL